MNKIIKNAAVLVLTLLLIFVFCGCASENTESKVNIIDKYIEMADEYIENGDLETAIKVLDEGVTKTGNPTLKEKLETVTKQFEEQNRAEEKTLWSEGYAQYMNDYSYSASVEQPIKDFALYDMNSDSVPELIFSTGTCEANYRIHFVTIIDKNATEIGDLSFGHTDVCGLEKENALILHYCHMSYENIQMLTLAKNKIQSIVLLDYDYYEHNDFSGYRQSESLTTTPYSYGIKTVEWESNPKDNNYEELKDLIE